MDHEVTTQYLRLFPQAADFQGKQEKSSLITKYPSSP